MSDARAADAEIVDRLIGEVLANRYRIEHRIGEGAMGSVYKARHIKVGRSFAVKILHPRLIEDEKVLRRFEREAELAGRLRHANVIGVVDVGETSDGLRYMVMDFVEGPDMSTLLGQAPMPPQRIIHLTRQLLEGLYHAHTAGLIHRDFKPENVIVERDSHGHEVPRIVDFGIAILREGGESPIGPGRLTTNGLVLGTPHYMAPEQAVNDPIDHRIDLFALGIMIYEMLCGKLPFDGSGAEVARANLLLDPPPISTRVPYLEVDPLLEAFARRLMAKSRDARPPTAKVARELLDLVERDRAAAAAALGVPLTSTRAPMTTADVAPQPKLDDGHPGTFPPPLGRDQIATPPQAPPMTSQVAQIEIVEETKIPTEDVHPQTRSKKRVGVIAGAFVATVGGVIAIALVASHGGKGADKQRAPIAPIASDPAPTQVAMAPTPAPQPPQPQPPPVVAPLVTAPVATAGSDVVAVTPVVAPPAKVVVSTAAKRPRTIPNKQVAAALPAQDPQPPATYDANAFLAQMNAVNNEVLNYAATHSGAVADLQARITRIPVQSAMSSPEKLLVAKAELDKIHAEFKLRQKAQP